MVLAYVMINAETGHKESTFKRIEKIEGVKDAYMCSGIYDIIVKIKYKTNERLREKILQIQKVNNVLSTLTMAIVA